MFTSELQTSGVYANGEWYTVVVELIGRNISLVIGPSGGSNMSESLSDSIPELVVPGTFLPAEDLLFVGGLPTSVQAIIGR